MPAGAAVIAVPPIFNLPPLVSVSTSTAVAVNRLAPSKLAPAKALVISPCRAV
ncbi:hypothetical protein D3C87_2116010 [compost metagenome]